MKIYRLSMVICLSLYSCTSSPVQDISPSNLPPEIEQTTVATSHPAIIPSANISVTPSVNPTNIADKENKIIDKYSEISAVGEAGNVPERVTIHGKIYDNSKNLLDNVIVTTKVINEIGNSNNNGWSSDIQTTIVGAYVLRNINIDDEILVIASKDGYITKSRKIVPISNLNGDANINVFNFGGENQSDSEFALEKIEN